LPELAYRYVLNNSLPYAALVAPSSMDKLPAAVRYPSIAPLPQGLLVRMRPIELAEETLSNPATRPVQS
jgi:hypothetical protein